MKKLIVALTLVLTAGIITASANVPADVNKGVVNAFYAEFNQARNVSWTSSANYIIAQFTLEHKVMYAYYKADGSFVGVVHHLLTADLPENLKNNLKKNYAAYWVTELFSVKNEEGTSYYVNLENGKESLILSSDNNTWSLYKISAKSDSGSASF